MQLGDGVKVATAMLAVTFLVGCGDSRPDTRRVESGASAPFGPDPCDPPASTDAEHQALVAEIPDGESRLSNIIVRIRGATRSGMP